MSEVEKLELVEAELIGRYNSDSAADLTGEQLDELLDDIAVVQFMLAGTITGRSKT